ncbi:hypothetical protein SORBI_3001G374301 [Sorghum bicolor]|uniref:Uncharacterized protein n=1 Tax=Sorghum bicolor TaxID=4558 RepID=A0A1Z5S9V9_SORBI|nr:hypothetical protein SORBI_3001G374301 [Sorghum bicolor]
MEKLRKHTSRVPLARARVRLSAAGSMHACSGTYVETGPQDWNGRLVMLFATSNCYAAAWCFITAWSKFYRLRKLADQASPTHHRVLLPQLTRLLLR